MNNKGSPSNPREAKRLGYLEAQREQWRINSISNYATNFGLTNRKQEDMDVLKHKKLSSLPIAAVLKPEVLEKLESWLSINDVEDFTRRIFNTVRDMQTVVRNQEAPLSLAVSQFKWVVMDETTKAPRFDKLIAKHRNRRLAAATQLNTSALNDSLNEASFEGELSPKRDPAYYMFADSPKEAKQARLRFLQGSGNLTNHCNVKDPSTTIYQDKFVGRQSDSKERLDQDWNTSFFNSSTALTLPPSVSIIANKLNRAHSQKRDSEGNWQSNDRRVPTASPHYAT